MTDEELNHQACRVLAHLFHNNYCVEVGLSGPAKVRAESAAFYAWCNRTLPEIDHAVRDDLLAKVDAPEEAWDQALALAGHGLPADTAPAWRMITLADRESPRHLLHNLALAVVYRWGDRVFVNAAHLTGGDGKDCDGVEDAGAANFVANAGRDLATAMSTKTLDELHDAALSDWGFREILRLAALRAEELGPQDMGKASGVAAWARWLTQLVYPKPVAGTPGGPTGGWAG